MGKCPLSTLTVTQCTERMSMVYRAVKCRLIWYFRGQALLLRVLHAVLAVACYNVRDCVSLKDDLNRVKRAQLIRVKLFVTN